MGCNGSMSSTPTKSTISHDSKPALILKNYISKVTKEDEDEIGDSVVNSPIIHLSATDVTSGSLFNVVAYKSNHYLANTEVNLRLESNPSTETAIPVQKNLYFIVFGDSPLHPGSFFKYEKLSEDAGIDLELHPNYTNPEAFSDYLNMRYDYKTLSLAYSKPDGVSQLVASSYISKFYLCTVPTELIYEISCQGNYAYLAIIKDEPIRKFKSYDKYENNAVISCYVLKKDVKYKGSVVNSIAVFECDSSFGIEEILYSISYLMERGFDLSESNVTEDIDQQ